MSYSNYPSRFYSLLIYESFSYIKKFTFFFILNSEVFQC